jgi:hypothetical protein
MQIIKDYNPPHMGKGEWLLFLIYLLAIAVGSSFHEAWRDELQTLMVIRQAHSLDDLFSLTRYDGHPSLWVLLLYLFKPLSEAVEGARLIHLALAAGSAFLLLRYSPFTLLQKALILSGYFLLYEYVFIVRNYAPGVFCFFLVCCLFPKRNKPFFFVLIALALTGMMLSNLYAFLLAMAVSVWLLLLQLQNRQWQWSFLTGYLILAAGAIAFILDIQPPDDYGYARDWRQYWDKKEFLISLSRIGQVMIPIPPLQPLYWNFTIISDTLLPYTGFLFLVLSVVILAFTPSSRVFIALLFIAVLSFSYIKFAGILRHNGHLWLGILGMMWIQLQDERMRLKCTRVSQIVFNGLLILHTIAGLSVIALDIHYPFSRSREAAEFIRTHYTHHLVLGHRDVGASSVCAWSDTLFYYPQSDQFGSFIWFTSQRNREINSSAELIRKGDSLCIAAQQPVIFLLTFPVNDTLLHEVARFEPAAENQEQYYIYLRRKP